MTKNTVYIVHCIDTEGPLYESIDATFQRINLIFGLNLTTSYDTLRKLQKEEIPLNGIEKEVANVVAPKRINTLDSWDKIDTMLDNITTMKFRNEFDDSYNNGWIYNWFCMDHVGFIGLNPRRRDIGHHNIFDHYELYNRLNNYTQDIIQWHYHPVAIVPDAHRSGNTYLNSSNIYEILSRKIIDRQWFPAAFRPGFHTERPDTNWFLEQWIPFDFGNLAVKGDSKIQPDVSGGRFGDWRRAPKTWRPYNPDINDYQIKGDCKRVITRCLNMDARYASIQKNDIIDAFKDAKEFGNSLLAFTNHDFRDMEPEIRKVGNLIKDVSKDFSKVQYKNSNAIQAMRNVMGLEALTKPNISANLVKKKAYSKLVVHTENKIFGLQPFLAIKLKSSKYYWQNFDFENENSWSFTFDNSNIEIEAVEKIGIAANTIAGVTEVCVFDVSRSELSRQVYNYSN